MSLLKSVMLAVAAAGLAAIAGVASASDYNLGTVSGTQYFGNGVNFGLSSSGVGRGPDASLLGQFNDKVGFTVAKPSNGNYGADTFALSWGTVNLSSVSNFNISLFSTSDPTSVLVSGLTGSFNNLSAGDYFLGVSGTGGGLFGGGYAGSISITAVPEPGQWALIFSGLGLISLVARRRSANRA